MNALFKVFNFIIVTFLVVSCQKRNSDEDNPYEFGFTIDGQQHRHEKKDSSGIIQGEFGFITADGIYHVTVYATDENGNFKILSMKNLRVSAPLDGSPLPPGAKIEGAAPGSPPGGNQIQSQQISNPNPPPISNAVAPVGINSPPVGQYSTQRPQFTTQPTIKPACAGCGYVTTAKPHGNKAPGFNFQTPEFQNNNNPQNVETFNGGSLQNPQTPNQPLLNEPGSPSQNPGGNQGIGGSSGIGGSFPQSNPGDSGVNPGFGGGSPQSTPGFTGQIPNRGGFPPTSEAEENIDNPGGFPPQNPGFPGTINNPGTDGFPPGAGIVGNNPGVAGPPQTNYPGGFPGNDPNNNLPGPFGGSHTQNQPQPPSPFNGLTVDKNIINVPNNAPIEIKDKYPGMSEGLPSGIKEGDITDLLYKFHYEVGFHGHYEKGLKDGSKVGGYFVNGRDGVSRVVTYVADENGYHPKFKFIRLDADKTPNEATEKTFGLKSFEFIWYPIK